MANAIEEMEKYLRDRFVIFSSALINIINLYLRDHKDDEEEEFDALVSGKEKAKKLAKKPESRKRELNADSDSSASGPSSSSTAKKPKGRPQLKDRYKEEPSSSHSERDSSPVGGQFSGSQASVSKKSSAAAVAGLLDRPTLARPVSPAIGMDLVTSSQTLREKDIQPSKLNFGFLGLGIMG